MQSSLSPVTEYCSAPSTLQARAHSANGTIKVRHIASGSGWAGAEVQISALLCALKNEPTLDLSAVLMKEGKLSKQLREAGVAVVVMDETALSSWGIFRRLMKHLREIKPDIVHTHGYKANVLGAAAAKFCRVRNVCRTVHGMPEPFQGFNRIKMSVYDLLDRFAARYLTDATVTVSLDIKQKLARKSPDAHHDSRIVCIRNSVDIDAITVTTSSEKKKQDLQIPPGHRVIMTAGRLVPVKGVDYFLKAARLIVEVRRDVTFLIVGDGPLRRILEKLSRDLKLEDHVRFLGWREDMYDLLNMADILVLASLHEGIPTILLEALAMGKSVVATRVGGIPEVIIDPALGTVIEPQSADAIATNCLQLLHSDSHSEAEKRKQYIASNFSANVSAQKVLKLYEYLSCCP
jgi:glycosyltransferase involved in cell wall biosynthesis